MNNLGLKSPRLDVTLLDAFEMNKCMTNSTVNYITHKRLKEELIVARLLKVATIMKSFSIHIINETCLYEFQIGDRINHQN